MIHILKKLVEDNPVSMFTKNDPGMYCEIRKATMKVEVIEIDHAKRHQDQEGKELKLIDRLSAIAN